MKIKIREYQSYETIKVFEYELDVEGHCEAIEKIHDCDLTYPDPIRTENSGECVGRTTFVINEDGSDGEELYTWW